MRISAPSKNGQQIAYRLQEGDVSDTERSRLSEYHAKPASSQYRANFGRR